MARGCWFGPARHGPRPLCVCVSKRSSNVVRADWMFTTTTIIFQPLSGWYLAHVMNLSLNSAWIVWSIALYLVAGACWLPVVWLQIRMRGLAESAARTDGVLPAAYWHMLKVWVALGIPAFVALVVVFYLMVAKPL